MLTIDHLQQLQNGLIKCELPNKHLYEFCGTLKLNNDNNEIPIGPDQILLRGSCLKNTKWIYGVVIYTGHETKIMMNASTPPFKRSYVEKATNTQILNIFILLIVICVVSTVVSEIWKLKNLKSSSGVDHWYIDDNNNFFLTFFTFIILYNNLIPISLQVTLEMVKFLQAMFINWDNEMYDEENDFPAVARTSTINEELGQIKYIFSDKTGTLTCNVMEFKRCTIAGISYGSGNEEEFNSYELLKNLDSHQTRPVIREFLSLLAICHTVIACPSDNSHDIEYQASSPDEGALVRAIQKFDIIFHSRQHDQINIKFLNETIQYKVLNVLEFNSTRKRMSIILRDPNGKIKLYCKGADNVLLNLKNTKKNDVNEDYSDVTIEHLESFAKEGLRTLVLAYKEISEREYEEWNVFYEKAAKSITERDLKVQNAAEMIEKDLIILGGTAIEDKLQKVSLFYV
jgi:phospholipid-transporting ATPase